MLFICLNVCLFRFSFFFCNCTLQCYHIRVTIVYLLDPLSIQNIYSGFEYEVTTFRKKSWAIRIIQLSSWRCKHIGSFNPLNTKHRLLYWTLILLTWTKWRAPASAIKWRVGFNSEFKGLKAQFLPRSKHF
jgi:hypothetical protein